jgi:phosphoglycolate phosphatase
MRALDPSLSIIFDLDGTLVDSLPGITAAIRYALRDYNVEVNSGQLRELIGPPIREILGKLAVSASESDLIVAEREFRSAYDSTHWKEAYLFTTARETLQALERFGVRLFLFTNKPENAATRILKELDLDSVFFDRMSRDSREPAFANKAEMLRELMAKHGLRAESAMVVGDSLEDFYAAQEWGVPFVFARYGYGRLDAEDRQKAAGQIDYLSSLLTMS